MYLDRVDIGEPHKLINDQIQTGSTYLPSKMSLNMQPSDHEVTIEWLTFTDDLDCTFASLNLDEGRRLIILNKPDIANDNSQFRDDPHFKGVLSGNLGPLQRTVAQA